MRGHEDKSEVSDFGAPTAGLSACGDAAGVEPAFQDLPKSQGDHAASVRRRRSAVDATQSDTALVNTVVKMLSATGVRNVIGYAVPIG